MKCSCMYVYISGLYLKEVDSLCICTCARVDALIILNLIGEKNEQEDSITQGCDRKFL